MHDDWEFCEYMLCPSLFKLEDCPGTGECVRVAGMRHNVLIYMVDDKDEQHLVAVMPSQSN